MNANVSAVYGIINTVNGKIYVGSSSDLKKRWCQHRSSMNMGKSSSKFLQRAWTKYGEGVFEMFILEVSDVNELIGIEQKWIDRLNVCDPFWGYNISEIAGVPPSRRGYKESESSIKKRFKKRSWYKHSDETKLRIGIGNKGKVSFFKGKTRDNLAKPIVQFSNNGDIIKQWDSAIKASNVLNINRSNITQCCKCNRKTAGGYIWKYKIEI